MQANNITDGLTIANLDLIRQLVEQSKQKIALGNGPSGAAVIRLL